MKVLLNVQTWLLIIIFFTEFKDIVLDCDTLPQEKQGQQRTYPTIDCHWCPGGKRGSFEKGPL